MNKFLSALFKIFLAPTIAGGAVVFIIYIFLKLIDYINALNINPEFKFYVTKLPIVTLMLFSGLVMAALHD
jgi:hypothetical protein